MKVEERLIIITHENSFEFQYKFSYDEEDNQIYFELNLDDSKHPWYNRLFRRIGFIFGVQTKFSKLNEIMIKYEDTLKIKEFISKIGKKK